MILLHRLRRFTLIAFAVFITAGLTGCAMSEAEELELGKKYAPEFLAKNGGNVPHPGVNAYVAGLGRKIAAISERPGLPWEFHVLDSEVINAFALPGGKVFISRGLMTRLSSEAELVAVLGHEVGHVNNKHISQQMQRQQIAQVGIQILGAATESQWATMIGSNATGLYLLKFGRDQESESDHLGMVYMTRLGYNPQGMLKVLQVLDKAAGEGGQIEMFSTHPNPKTRIQSISSEIKAHPEHNQYPLHEDPYKKNALEPLSKLPPPKHGRDPAAK